MSKSQQELLKNQWEDVLENIEHICTIKPKNPKSSVNLPDT
jgi:hypothetical protein